MIGATQRESNKFLWLGNKIQVRNNVENGLDEKEAGLWFNLLECGKQKNLIVPTLKWAGSPLFIEFEPKSYLCSS